MAKEAVQHCEMRYSIPLMAAVIVCNFIKGICMGTLSWKLDSHPLATLGDAIASFLDAPDMDIANNVPFLLNTGC